MRKNMRKALHLLFFVSLVLAILIPLFSPLPVKAQNSVYYDNPTYYSWQPNCARYITYTNGGVTTTYFAITYMTVPTANNYYLKVDVFNVDSTTGKATSLAYSLTSTNIVPRLDNRNWMNFVSTIMQYDSTRALAVLVNIQSGTASYNIVYTAITMIFNVNDGSTKSDWTSNSPISSTTGLGGYIVGHTSISNPQFDVGQDALALVSVMGRTTGGNEIFICFMRVNPVASITNMYLSEQDYSGMPSPPSGDWLTYSIESLALVFDTGTSSTYRIGWVDNMQGAFTISFDASTSTFSGFTKDTWGSQTGGRTIKRSSDDTYGVTNNKNLGALQQLNSYFQVGLYKGNIWYIDLYLPYSYRIGSVDYSARSVISLPLAGGANTAVLITDQYAMASPAVLVGNNEPSALWLYTYSKTIQMVTFDSATKTVSTQIYETNLDNVYPMYIYGTAGIFILAPSTSGCKATFYLGVQTPPTPTPSVPEGPQAPFIGGNQGLAGSLGYGVQLAINLIVPLGLIFVPAMILGKEMGFFGGFLGLMLGFVMITLSGYLPMWAIYIFVIVLFLGVVVILSKGGIRIR